MDLFLYDSSLRHEIVKSIGFLMFSEILKWEHYLDMGQGSF